VGASVRWRHCSRGIDSGRGLAVMKRSCRVSSCTSTCPYLRRPLRPGPRPGGLLTSAVDSSRPGAFRRDPARGRAHRPASARVVSTAALVRIAEALARSMGRRVDDGGVSDRWSQTLSTLRGSRGRRDADSEALSAWTSWRSPRRRAGSAFEISVDRCRLCTLFVPKHRRRGCRSMRSARPRRASRSRGSSRRDDGASVGRSSSRRELPRAASE